MLLFSVEGREAKWLARDTEESNAVGEGAGNNMMNEAVSLTNLCAVYEPTTNPSVVRCEDDD